MGQTMENQLAVGAKSMGFKWIIALAPTALSLVGLLWPTLDMFMGLGSFIGSFYWFVTQFRGVRDLNWLVAWLSAGWILVGWLVSAVVGCVVCCLVLC
jgi:hypothetical protein